MVQLQTLDSYFRVLLFKLFAWIMGLSILVFVLISIFGSYRLNNKSNQLLTEQIATGIVPILEVSSYYELAILVQRLLDDTNLVGLTVVEDSQPAVVLFSSANESLESADFIKPIYSENTNTKFQIYLWFDNSLITLELSILVVVLVSAFVGIFLLLVRKLNEINSRVILETVRLREFVDSQNFLSVNSINVDFSILELKNFYSSFRGLLRRLESQATEIERLRSYSSKVKLARQVNHDMKSPLAGLNMIADSNEIRSTGESGEILRQCLNRIESILKTMDPDSMTDIKKRHLFHPALVIAEVLQQSSYTFPMLEIDFNLEDSLYSLKVLGDEVEFYRLLQNILLNSQEASTVDQKLSVNIYMERKEEFLLIILIDNGPGFPKDIFDSLGQEGASFGKKGGTGLGLYHAVETLNSFGGSIKFNNADTRGAEVTIYVPISVLVTT